MTSRSRPFCHIRRECGAQKTAHNTTRETTMRLTWQSNCIYIAVPSMYDCADVCMAFTAHELEGARLKGVGAIVHGVQAST
jgi:hypothetical protein